MDLVESTNAKLVGLDTKPIPTRVVAGDNALDDIAEVVAEEAGSGPIIILSDDAGIRHQGIDTIQEITESLQWFSPVRCVLAGLPAKADEPTLEIATSASAGHNCIVTVGSGTITDIGKVASAATGIPLVAVQSAASVNGYADDLAVVLRTGVKRTIPAVWPAALVIDYRLIEAAPLALNRAGVGEMMSMFTAPLDWKLAAVVGADTGFRQEIVDLYRHPDRLWELAPGVGRAEKSALRTLTELLTVSGMAMGAVGKTAPLSGAEHAISHLIDMSSEGATGLHGAQVGVAAVIASCVWQVLLEGFNPDSLTERHTPTDEEAGDRIEHAFAPLGAAAVEECRTAYLYKLAGWRTARSAARTSLRPFLTEAPSLMGEPAAMVASLEACGAAATFSGSQPEVTAARVRWAVVNSHLMRDRFSVFDLAVFGGWDLGQLVDEAMRRATEVGGGW